MTNIQAETTPLYIDGTLIIGGEKTTVTVFPYTANILHNPELKIHQVNGLCFPIEDSRNLVAFIDNNGHYGVPGGRIENGETSDEALKREVMEETNCEVITSSPIAYSRWHFQDTNQKDVLIWYKCTVKLLEGDIKDSDEEAKRRVLVPTNEFEEKLRSMGHLQAVLNLAKKQPL